MIKKLNRTLVVDGQIFQSIARHRGMGRYSEYLLSAILDEDSYDEITLILAKDLRTQDTGDLIELFKDATIVYLNLKNANTDDATQNEAYNKQVINNYVSKIIDKTIVDFLILSAFQEPIVSVFPDNVNKYAIFYDLIPYLFYDKYVAEMPFDKYLSHFKILFEADKLLCISEAVRDDLVTYIGIPIEKTEAIHGAAIRSEREPVPPNFKIPEKFILLPTGDDFRKNNLRTVLGFEKFNAKHGDKYKLIITSNIHVSEKAKLKKVSKNIIFTGNVNETILDWLYEAAEAVLFVPETEGLGLPILEAVKANQRIICSSIDVFKEISKDAFYFCDYSDVSDIAKAIDRALSDLRQNIPVKEYARILNFYSWKKTAQRTVSAMMSNDKKSIVKKPRIAVFTPTPDGVSAIGKVVAETHGSLIKYFEVDYYSESGPPVTMRPNYLKYVANFYPATQFAVESYKKYDAVFYHIGNSEYHLESIANSLYIPGYAILHDTNIGDAFKVMLEKDMISKQRYFLEEAITKRGRFSLSNHLGSVVANQQGIITHSEYAVGAVHEIDKTAYVNKVNLPTSVPATLPERSYKTLRLGLAGIIADVKGTEVIERLVKDKRYQNHHFSLFGFNYSTGGVLARLKSYENVEVATNVTDLDFVRRMRQLDIFVNYRMRYQGETSLSTLEAMRQGVVVIVRDIGWYAELPDNAVIKVHSIEDIEAKINELLNNLDSLRLIAKNAIEYIKKNHSHDEYAQSMLKMLHGSSKDISILQTTEALKNGTIKSKADLREIRRII